MKLNTVKLGVLALGLFGFSLTMSAQEKKEPNFEKMLKRFDADANGSISLEEFTSAKRKNEIPAEKLEKQYAKLDADKDGAVTLVELKENWGKSKGKGKGKNKKKQD
ncbi:hypothetical protein AAFN75_02715 [Algibacter sp. AS12]|uniref:hypothetical protein n=1 Tax=Algibacter sp. AS12 TaxID=3135773 RepID=UPI00398B474D